MDPCGRATHLGTRSLLSSSNWPAAWERSTEESHTEVGHTSETVTSILVSGLLLYDLQKVTPLL